MIFIGQSGCGKTTLCQKLNEEEIRYKKTQAVERYGESIDTPGEYLENRHFYNALIMSAVDAGIIALVADPTSEYPGVFLRVCRHFREKGDRYYNEDT